MHAHPTLAVSSLSGRWSRVSLTAKILAGILCGIAAGLFFGESAQALEPLGNLYIRLTQMTVLPYLMIALIAGLGKMQATDAIQLAKRASFVLLIFSAISICLVMLMTLAFPSLVTASFFSSGLSESRQELSILEIMVPSNPFNAMANNAVPGVVLFSIVLGAALIGVPDKTRLLAQLEIAEKMISRVTHFILSLTPIGIFAITAQAAGTLSLDTVSKLGVYLISFAGAALLLTFVVLPLLVTAVLPFRYKEIVTLTSDCLLTAFASANVFIILPILVDRAQELIKRHNLSNEQTRSTLDILIPLAFIFPNAGRLLPLLFIPYCAWLTGHSLGYSNYAELSFIGFFALFAKAQVALPFLLNFLSIPADNFQLYLPTTIITGRLDSMVSAMLLFTFSLTGAAAMAGQLKLEPYRLLLRLMSILGAILLTIAALRLFLGYALDQPYSKDQIIKNMHLPRTQVQATFQNSTYIPEASVEDGVTGIINRGVLRVGFSSEQLPLIFLNKQGDLVGLDVELASLMAETLGVKRVEFIQAHTTTELLSYLNEKRVDILMSIPYSQPWIKKVNLSQPYFDGVIGIAMLDSFHNEFNKPDGRSTRGTLTLGLTAAEQHLESLIRRSMPGVSLQFETVSSQRNYFEGKYPNLDGLVTFAASASAWSLLYPRYGLALLPKGPYSVPSGIATRLDDPTLRSFIDTWLIATKGAGDIKHATEYWVQGKGTEIVTKRWSVMHNILGWN